MNNTVTTQAEKLEEPDGQARKMDSLKESQNNNRPRSSETVSTLSNWSLGFMLATICFIVTMDVVMISSPLDKQEILHARVREQQHPTWHITYYRSYYNQALRNWTEQIQESGIHMPQMTGKGVRFSPKPSLQKAPELEGGILEEMDQTTTLNQIAKPKESRWTERQERKTERNLLFMIASGVVCQAMSHTGYGWGVSLLTLLAMGVQGQDANEPWTPVVVTLEDGAEVRKRASLEIPGSPARESRQHTTKIKQATTPVDDSWCENNKPHKEKVD